MASIWGWFGYSSKTEEEETKTVLLECPGDITLVSDRSLRSSHGSKARGFISFTKVEKGTTTTSTKRNKGSTVGAVEYWFKISTRDADMLETLNIESGGRSDSEERDPVTIWKFELSSQNIKVAWDKTTFSVSFPFLMEQAHKGGGPGGSSFCKGFFKFSRSRLDFHVAMALAPQLIYDKFCPGKAGETISMLLHRYNSANEKISQARSQEEANRIQDAVLQAMGIKAAVMRDGASTTPQTNLASVKGEEEEEVDEGDDVSLNDFNILAESGDEGMVMEDVGPKVGRLRTLASTKLGGKSTVRIPATADDDTAHAFANQSSHHFGVFAHGGPQATMGIVSYENGLSSAASKKLLNVAPQTLNATSSTTTGGPVNVDQIVMHPSTKSHAILHNAEDDYSLFKMDIEREKVVGTFQANGGADYGYEINSVTKQHRSDNPNILCALSDKAIYTMDLRAGDQSRAAVHKGDLNDLKHTGLSGNKCFTCHATSPDGALAVGDGLGQIRFFSGVPGAPREGGGVHPKTAKTLLKGSGNLGAVEALDIDNKSLFVCATYAHQISIISATGEKQEEDSSAVTKFNGFDESLNKKTRTQKPCLVPLTLTVEQINYLRVTTGLQNPEFKEAKFESDGELGEAISVVATLHQSNHVIYWSMRDIKPSILGVAARGGGEKYSPSGRLVATESNSNAQDFAFLGAQGHSAAVGAGSATRLDLLVLTETGLEHTEVSTASNKKTKK